MVCIFWSCACQSRSSSVGGEADAPPFSILPILARSTFSPLWFSFSWCISPPWIFAFAGFSAVSDLDSHLRGPLRSWGSFSCLMSPTFSEGAPKWLENFLHRFRAIWRLCYVLSLRGYLILPPVLRLSCRSSGGASFWDLLIVPMFSLILGGSPTFLEGLLRSRERVLGSLLTSLSTRRLLAKKVSTGYLPLSPTDFDCSRLYYFSVRRRG